MLAKRFGWTLDEIDAASSIRCDWLLAVGVVDDEVNAAQRRREMEAMMGGSR